MKRCPECRRDYYDDSLLYCLDDGNSLLEGPGSLEAKTAILRDAAVPDEEPTRIFDTGDGTDDTSVHDSPSKDHKWLRSYRVLVPAALFLVIVIAAITYLTAYSNWILRRSSHAISSVMVLPLKNIGPEDEYLADGLTDELTSRLTKLKTVRVVAPSAAMRYKNSPKDAAEIGREMSVEAVIEGTVRKQADKFRVSLHLINVADGFELWSDSDFEGDVGDLLGAQSRLAELMAGRLKGELTSQEKDLIVSRTTTNADAYELFLKGKLQFRSGQKTIARQMFDRAIQLDPDFAEAYAWRGRAAYDEFKGGRGDRSTLDAALADANHALQIQPDLASARNTLINIYHSTGQYEEGLKQGKLALETSPNDLDAIEGSALAYFRAGMINKAIPLYERAVTADPTDPEMRSDLARSYLLVGESQKAIDVLVPALQRRENVYWMAMWSYQALGLSDKAIEMGRAAAERNPNSGFVTLDYGTILQNAGRKDEARKVWLSIIDKFQAQLADYENVRIRIWLAFTYARLGEMTKAIEQLERSGTLEPNDPWVLYQTGCVQAILNNRNKAIQGLQQAENRGWLGVHYLNSDSDPEKNPGACFARLREDPDFQKIRSDLQKKVDELATRY